jgi:hypothetical protein
MTQTNCIPSNRAAATSAIGRFLDDLGWGVLFITVGVFWLMPTGRLPHGSWMIAVGFVILDFSAARYLHRIPVSGCALAAGIVFLAAGIGAAFGINLPAIPIAMVVVGVSMLLASEPEGLPSSPGQRVCCR